MRTVFYVVAAAALSAATYFYGTGLHPLWYLTWFAPLPVLAIAPRLSRQGAALTAFLAFAFGSLNTWRFYSLVLPLTLRIVIVFAMSAVLALIAVVFRSCVLQQQWVRALLLPPAVWVAVEYLVEFRSPNSTSNNLAYSQMNNLHVLQLVSVTGIWGISFLLLLVPAAIALCTVPTIGWHGRRVVGGAGALCAVVIGYGSWRLHHAAAPSSVTVALIDSDQPAALFPSGEAAIRLVQAYARQVPALAQSGAAIVILPEKVGRLTADEIAEADRILAQAAASSHVRILAGYEQWHSLNEARLYSTSGATEGTYEKHHMVPAFESSLLPGTSRILVDTPAGKLGIAICKDMDFPRLSRQYSIDGAGLLLVPAWDFSLDGWLHGRMAIMRGVESGFSIARAARQGRLSLSDARGRVLAEKVTSATGFVTLIGNVPIHNEPTLYARNGDWFAWFDLTLLAILVGRRVRNHSLAPSRNA